MPDLVVVRGADPPRAEALAARLGLPLVDRADPARGGFALAYDGHGRLGLGPVGARAPRPVTVDFGSPELARRSRRIGGRLPVLARALGLDRGIATVVDATAGLGRDAWVLAAAGATVTMVERDPVLAALLDDALQRARALGLGPVARLRLVVADAVDSLRDLDPPPDAVYIDPMFADRGKAALPGRDLQLLRALLGPGGDDVAALFAAARAVARRRVVVKRPARAAALAAAIASYGGGQVRYDVHAPCCAAPGPEPGPEPGPGPKPR